MAFDPTRPAHGAPIDSAELRSQLTSLKALIDFLPTTLDVDAMMNESTAVNIDALPAASLTVSNPPTQAEVQAIIARLNQLIGALQH